MLVNLLCIGNLENLIVIPIDKKRDMNILNILPFTFSMFTFCSIKLFTKVLTNMIYNPCILPVMT